MQKISPVVSDGVLAKLPVRLPKLAEVTLGNAVVDPEIVKPTEAEVRLLKSKTVLSPSPTIVKAEVVDKGAVSL